MPYYSPRTDTYFPGTGMSSSASAMKTAAWLGDNAAYRKERDARIAAGSRATYNNKMSGDYASEHARQAQIAAGQQVTAANQMFGLQAGQRQQGRADIQAGTAAATGAVNPWRAAGVDALGKLQTKIGAGPGEFERSPGYEFRLSEGQKALEASASARGGALSGAAVKGAMRYGQDFATNDYDNFLRRYYDSMKPLQEMSGQGYTAGAQQGQFEQQGARDLTSSGQAATNQMAGATQYRGESRAGGTMNAANIMAIAAQAQQERDYGYEAWQQGGNF